MDGPETTTNPEPPIGSPVWSETTNLPRPYLTVRPPSTPLVSPGDSSEPPPEAESRARLRLRMRRGATVGSLALLLFLLHDLAFGRYRTPFDRIGLVSHVAATLVGFAIAAILWSPRRLEKWHLRALDLLIIAAPVAFFAWFQWDMFRFDPGILALPQAVIRDLAEDRSDACMLRWFGLIIFYGISIPDSWLRCAAHSLLIATVPFVVTWAACAANGTRFVFFHIWLEMLIWAAISVLFVTYSSHRIDKLWWAAITGRRLGQYHLIRSLERRGGMGEIYLALHPLLSRPCVIKRVRSERAHDETSRVRFEREARATAQLTHWNNVRVFDFGQDEDGMFYYVMEYLDGIDLEALVEKGGAIPPARAIHFLLQVCDALQEAHALGLIHRDIKPSNIMCCRRGVVDDVAVLLDYGIARSASRGLGAGRLTLEDALIGTPAYMSPEQASGRDADERSDLYSLGAVAFYLVTARPPFPGSNLLQLLSDQKDKPAPRPGSFRDGIPDDLERVILKCLEKAPERRFQGARDLREALSACECAGRWTEQAALD
jgi:serine/threonine-protein kinase